MILATYEQAGRRAIGVVTAGRTRVLDLARAAAAAATDAAPFADMLALIDAGEAGLDTARGLVERYADDDELGHALADVRLLAPVPEPRQMRDFLVFPLHIQQTQSGMRGLAVALWGEAEATRRLGPPRREPPTVPDVHRQQPAYYKGNRFSVIGTGHDVRWPRYCRYLDYELEYGIFIGRTALDVPAARAREHIFGYTIFNDFSARDAQLVESFGWLGPCKGKDFDTGNAIGPWIVTRDEIPDPYDLKMAVRVNGELRGEGTSAGMLHSFEDMIAHVSRDETIRPGEFFGSGTMGNGCGLEHGRWLEDGDVVELEVERIGVLRNRVRKQA